jgi:FlgD Ig-like domain
MNPTRGLVIPCLLLAATLLLFGVDNSPASIGPTPTPNTNEVPNIVRYDESALVQSQGAPGLAKAVADSFNIYGGRKIDGTNDRRPEGQFQDFILFPLSQGWFGVDRTENPTFWHVSTFNADSFPGGPGNKAMFSGVEAGTGGYMTAPGYGNNWNDVLQWEGLTNPAQFTTVRVQFDFNHDTEPGYDYFSVDYDSAGAWIELAAFDGANKDSTGAFLTQAFDQSVLFTPLMYSGTQNAGVRLRLRVRSDGAWSDEDGLYPTKGAAQVDNVRVSFNGVLVTNQGDDGLATFEDTGNGDDTEGWQAVSAEFAGDFAKVIPQLRDIDPCRQNTTPQLAFIDDGSLPSNSSVGTGGAISPNWSYGVRDGWVVNFDGGVSFGSVSLNNEFWSPEIAWDDTSSTLDDGLVGGAFMRYTVWQHLPLTNGIFWTWSVRSEVGGTWSSWQNRNFVYYGGGVANFINVQNNVTDLLDPNPNRVQMALGVIDLAETFGFPGTDATPSPTFDNVSFWRYDLGGPAFTTRNIDLFQDSFANSGSVDFLGDPSALSVRIDMARDVSTGLANIAGDSIVVDVSPTVPGSALAGLPVMKWVLEGNPLFDGVRSIPSGASSLGAGAKGWNRWMGTVTGDSARTSGGAVVGGRFFFDAPNDGPPNPNATVQTVEPAMFFPGDRFRYFIESSDDLGNVATLPADTTGFMGSSRYNRVFTVKALPTVTDDGLGGTTQPRVLVINDFGHRGGEGTFLNAFDQNGLFEDTDFDVYTVQGPSSLVSNGIGSAGVHGANGQQLGGYEVLMYLAGNLSSGLISDGSNLNGNDKGADVLALTQWHALSGDRYAVYFGDDLCTFLSGAGSETNIYLSTIMSVDYQDNDVRDDLGGQAVSLVQSSGAAGGVFAQSFVGFGGCLGINQFDSILPLGGAVRSHEFMSNATGLPLAPAASVWHARLQDVGGTNYNRVDMTFPFGFLYIYEPLAKAPVGISVRTLLLAEILNAFGQPVNSGGAVPAPSASSRLVVQQNLPNPFNPVTTIRFVTPRSGDVKVRIFNLRGELVRVLHDGTVEAGAQRLVWDGTDARGASVASGVYVYEVKGFGDRVTQKMALVK